MTKEKLKQEILKVVKNRPGASFAELQRLVNGFRGEFSLCSKVNPNIYLWLDVSAEAIEALNELQTEEQIFPMHAPLMVYLIDGVTLQMPLVKSGRQYKKPHWLPVTFSTKRPKRRAK